MTRNGMCGNSVCRAIATHSTRKPTLISTPGRLRRATDSDGFRHHDGGDGEGNLVLTIDPMGRSTTRTCNGAGVPFSRLWAAT